ncbi:hypothetical protein Avbf_11575 [Armadillidium vulgare]|nr:hypothetical protein Avbf_11575 [Armadillidium vulgare]
MPLSVSPQFRSYSHSPLGEFLREIVSYVSERKGCYLEPERVLSSQLLPLAYARSGSNLSTKPPFLAACLLADAARTCREGPRTPNSRPSSASQADSETQLGSPCTASPRPLLLAVPPRILSREFVVSSVKACVDRRVLSSQLLPLAYARSGSNLSTKPPFWQLCSGGCSRTCREGPNSELSTSSASQADSGTQLGSSSTASPPHKGASSEVSRSTVRCVERKGVCGQKGALVSASALAYARSGSNLSTKPPFWQLVCWRLLHGRAREGPELRTLDQALQGRRTTGRNFGCFFYCVSTSSPPHESLGNRSQGKSCPNR